MTEVVAIASAALAATCVVGMLLLVAWVRSAIDAQGAAQDAQRAAERAAAKAEGDRDDAIAQKTQAVAERDDARRQAASYAASLQAAREELTKRVKDTLANGTDADVAAEVDRLLSAPLPSVHPATPPAG